jgi:uncharacterized membrane protein
MVLMILGLILWIGAHLFKHIAPALRARMGQGGRGVIAAAIVAGLILMVIGYRGADFVDLWYPPSFMIHINNLLMLLAVWVFGSSAAKGAKAWPASRIRHPQLTAVKIWAFAHLLVNGDLASVILFGTLLGWAVASVIVINRTEPMWTPPPPAGRKTYIRLAIISVVVFVVATGIHVLLGVSPFPI